MGGALDAKHEHGVEHSVTFDGCTWTLITACRHFKMFESLLKHTICAEVIYRCESFINSKTSFVIKKIQK